MSTFIHKSRNMHVVGSQDARDILRDDTIYCRRETYYPLRKILVR